jgi:hypothetical protein
MLISMLITFPTEYDRACVLHCSVYAFHADKKHVSAGNAKRTATSSLPSVSFHVVSNDTYTCIRSDKPNAGAACYVLST